MTGKHFNWHSLLTASREQGLEKIMTKTIGAKRNPGKQVNFAKDVLRHYGFCAVHAGEGVHLTQVYNGPTGVNAIAAISREMHLMVANIKVTPLDATGNAVGESVKL